MKAQYVTFTVEVTARVEATEWNADQFGVDDVSDIHIEGMKISLANTHKELYEYLEEQAAETAIETGEWV